MLAESDILLETKLRLMTLTVRNCAEVKNFRDRKILPTESFKSPIYYY